MSSPTVSNQDEEIYDSVKAESAWRSAWQNNKGAALILFAECFGSSTDAIVRYLQQGKHGMHPFQVRVSSSVSFEDLFTNLRSSLHA